MDYDSENRGEFQMIEGAKQLVSFSGMKYEGRSGYRSVTPTDIDGFIQLDKYDAFIFFELKHHGFSPSGQFEALKKMVDGLSENHNSVLFIATHNAPTGETITAKDSQISHYYQDGKLIKCDGVHYLGEGINKYISYLKKVKPMS